MFNGQERYRHGQVGPVGVRLAHLAPTDPGEPPGGEHHPGDARASSAQGGITLGLEQILQLLASSSERQLKKTRLLQAAFNQLRARRSVSTIALW
jgi:hypothetical protein